MGIDVKNYSLGKSKAPSPKKEKASEGSWKDLMNKEIHLFGHGMNLKRKEALYSDLGVLLSAGLDIQRALSLIENNQQKAPQKALIASIKATVLAGDSLSAALRKTGYFSDYEVYSIQIGEESGQLLSVLQELSAFYAKSMRYKQQLVSALSYPTFVISFAFLVIFFLLKYLVPLFSDVYQKFDGELPAITQKIIYLSDWIGQNGFYLIGSVALIIALLYWQRRQIWFRKFSASFMLNSPIFGPIFQRIYLSRFCQSMFLLLQARVPLLKAVELVRLMVGFYPIEVSLEQAEKDILQGSLLNETLSKSSFYPQQFIALIQVGEEASTLEQMFQKLAKQYSDEAEQRTNVIGSLLEPILIIGL
ncbi:MAG: type II secretion system F family protein, partial [Bacteroidota bacterium]